MAFESLAEKIQGAFKKLTNRGKLTESDVKEAMRDVRMALLEADVNYSLVKDFIKKVTERAVGSEILSSLTPAQQVIKIVDEELTLLMGGQNVKLTHSPSVPTIYMMCGLQGAGKPPCAQSWASSSPRTASARCWWPATCTAPRPSASCKSWAARPG